MILSGMTMSPIRNVKVVFVGPNYVSGKAFFTKMETIASLKGSTSQAYVEKVLPNAMLVTTENYHSF